MPVLQPFCTPWRLVTIVPDLNGLVRSHLAQDVNPPATEVPDWVRPARALWAWWAYENGAQLYTQSRAYVDYAADMGFEALTLDCGWYADKARHLLPLWASWGVAGLKIDFFEDDSQRTMATYGMLARLACECKLMLNFHGSTSQWVRGAPGLIS